MKGAGLIGFLVGAVVGSAVTYLYFRSKNEVVEYEPEEATNEIPTEKVDIPKTGFEESKEYSEFASPYRSTYSEKYNQTVELQKDQMEASKSNKPQVIEPGLFGDDPEYSKFTLKYYKDGVLLDSSNNPIENVEGTVGEDFADHFGEYEEDSVYIRNDAIKSYFEILYVDYDFMDNE